MADQLVHPNPRGRDTPDPPFVAQRIVLVDGRIMRRETRLLARPTRARCPRHGNRLRAAQQGRQERDKVHPRLRAMLRDLAPGRRIQLLVVFTDQPELPLFPRPIPGEPRRRPVTWRSANEPDRSRNSFVRSGRATTRT